MKPNNNESKSKSTYPFFEIDPNDIIFLSQPKEYYEYLKVINLKENCKMF